jgi:putative nucleotidyltransferase with HDIG domain
MRVDGVFLTSKVARRIFALFIVCALVPIVALAVVSFGQVNRQLYEQGQERLDVAVRTVGQGIAERLLLLEAELRITGGRGALAATDASGDGDNPFAAAHFTALVQRDGATLTLFFGDVPILPALTAADYQHLASERTLLTAEPRSGQPPLVVLTRAVDPSDPTGGVLSAVVNPRFLWAGGADTLPRYNDLCVFNHAGAVLFCTRPSDGALPDAVRAQVAAGGSGAFEWNLDSEEQLASYWSLPLDYQFGVPQWTLMLSEAKAEVLAPIAAFRRLFPLVVLISLWVVLLLSIGQIRRSLDPLERLRAGTQRLADRQFDSRVEIDSGDEFEELADSFNKMAGRLGKQFQALATIAEIDRTILSSLDIAKIVDTVLRHTTDLVACDGVSVTLMAADQQKVPRTYVLLAGADKKAWVETTYFNADELRAFSARPEVMELGPEDGAPSYLAPLARVGCHTFLVLPMWIAGEPAGAIALGFTGAAAANEEDLLQARQLADQVAVALANARLVEDLDALNWGALTALARTVDAKSPWTAGHSERVTSMGLKIGGMMGLRPDQIDVLHRGGLLHDIGKIGVPAAILDKPAKLTEEEYAVMKKHPEIGANILQPIAAYADVIPIVREHHERWDGSGYPNGLAGTQIHLYARVFAVADVYDALISDRPYRRGLPVDSVICTIAAGDGTEFDPDVVRAFLDVMTEEGHGVLGAAASRRHAVPRLRNRPLTHLSHMSRDPA